MPSVLTTIIHFFKSTKVNDRRYEGLCRKKKIKTRVASTHAVRVNSINNYGKKINFLKMRF